MSRYCTAFGPILIELLNILTDLNSLFALSKSVVQWPKTRIFAAAPNAVRYLDIVICMYESNVFVACEIFQFFCSPPGKCEGAWSANADDFTMYDSVK